MGAESDRCVRAAAARARSVEAFARSGQGHAAAASVTRPDGAAANAGGARRVSGGHVANAYEKVVDRLLRSPQYGERMAFPWLDAARYADSNGYQTDGERFMWRWRDWVIDAFNRNMPYDQFTIEQLAGDLLPNATLDQKIATGFNRNHRGNSEGGIVPEEYAVGIRRRSRGHDLDGVSGPDGRRARDATTTSSIRSRRRSSISSLRTSTTCPSTASSGVSATRRRTWRHRFRSSRRS